MFSAPCLKKHYKYKEAQSKHISKPHAEILLGETFYSNICFILY